MVAVGRYIGARLGRRRRGRVLVAAGLAATVGVVTGAARPASIALAADGVHAIAMLNAQRAANGIPGGIAVDPALSAACAAHDRYMAHGHGLTPNEVPGRAGYTATGAYAGAHAVLARGVGWDGGDPYEHAPLHLDQLLAPRLVRAGSADADGYSCTTTFPGWTRSDPSALTVYTYPGNGTSIYPRETAAEQPFTPGDLVGLHQPATTGPNLLVLVDAPGQSPIDNAATLSGAWVAGPQGAVAVRTVDGNTRLPGGGTLAPYLSPGGFIIPVRPLLAGATYRAHVVVTFGGVRTVHDWSFIASGANPRSVLQARGNALAFRSASPVPIRITFTRAGGAEAPAMRLLRGHGMRLHLPPGSWQVCGVQPAGSGFAAYSGCLVVTVIGSPGLSLRHPVARGATLHIGLRFDAVLRGRRARLTVTALLPRCPDGGCGVLRGPTRASWVRLHGETLTLPLPSRHHGVQVTLATSAFQLRDASWRPARVTLRWVRG